MIEQINGVNFPLHYKDLAANIVTTTNIKILTLLQMYQLQQLQQIIMEIALVIDLKMTKQTFLIFQTTNFTIQP